MIRPATVDDVPVVVSLVHELATYEREPDRPVALAGDPDLGEVVRRGDEHLVEGEQRTRRRGRGGECRDRGDPSVVGGDGGAGGEL